MDFKELHDSLLQIKPEGVSHDEASCLICSPETISSVEGGDMKTYTEDEFNAAVREAVAPFSAELEKLRASQAEGEVEARIAAAVAEVEVKLVELQSELDKAELRASEALKERDDIVAFLESEAQAAANAAALEIKRSERRDAIKEVASFSDDYIEANIDRWVAMEEDAFSAVLEDWKAIAIKAKAEDKVEVDVLSASAETAMQNTRSEDAVSDVKTLLGSVFGGTDVRKVY